ncbi:GNAT family N-acetyltransferase [Actinoplanes regularis]|uniref:GNAT family N-acetyltransferase n=1 Tax=Actinoplanes regularis TaxID=52697 RepID=UPI0024A21B19|nr:GNAT family protein [Actinoplanes regularis]GLW35668.1 hypothetical protein Areg01_86030 [Actinoplanes regularis]
MVGSPTDGCRTRSFWGQGVASRALALLLEAVRVRPLFARAASDNVRSLKVLQRAGFTITGTDTGFANGRNAEVEETSGDEAGALSSE